MFSDASPKKAFPRSTRKRALANSTVPHCTHMQATDTTTKECTHTYNSRRGRSQPGHADQVQTEDHPQNDAPGCTRTPPCRITSSWGTNADSPGSRCAGNLTCMQTQRLLSLRLCRPCWNAVDALSWHADLGRKQATDAFISCTYTQRNAAKETPPNQEHPHAQHISPSL